MKNEQVVHFAFPLLATVQILALKLPGTIYARCDRGHGLHEYRLVWWADGKRFDEWLYETEISLR